MNTVRTVGSTLGWGLFALAITILIGGVWTGLLIVNLASTPAIPWSAVVMSVLLWVFWTYLSGQSGPRRTSVARQQRLRANNVSREVFTWAFIAGLLSIAALTGYWIILIQSARMPPRVLPDYAKYPLITVVVVVVMGSVVTAVAEEAAFRGYFQGTLQHSFRPASAVVIAALVISPAHGLTQGFAWPTIVFYLLVDVMFGAMAYFAGSILPGIVVHTVGLLIFFTAVWPKDAARVLVKTRGMDAWSWAHAAQGIAFTILAIAAFRHLAGLARRRTNEGGARV